MFKPKLTNSIVYSFCMLWLMQPCLAQSLDHIKLEDCHEWSRTNFPLIQQLDIIEKTKTYTLSNVSKGYLPQVNINGQASYQSAVTSLPIELPNIDIPTISKDQYKIYGEVYMPLTERRNEKVQKKLIDLNAEADKQNIEVELYKIKERINGLYFGILLIDEQINQAKLVKNDLQAALGKVDAAVKNGTASQFDLDLILAEMYVIDQKVIELKSNRTAYVKMLSVMTAKDLDEKTNLEQPISFAVSNTINRPELALFNIQSTAITAQNDLIDNRLIPRLGLFLQSGYGRPALNFLSNDFEFYYLGGLRLNWNLSSLYSRKNDREILNLNRSKIQVQKETFLLNTALTSSQQSTEIEKYLALIEADKGLVEVRERLKNTANVQLDNGIITALDYTKYIDAAYQARQNLIIHELLLLKAQYDYQTTIGK